MTSGWHRDVDADPLPPIDRLDHWPRHLVDVVGDEPAIDLVRTSFSSAEACGVCERDFRQGEHRSLRIELEGEHVTDATVLVGHVQCMRPSLTWRHGSREGGIV